MASTPDFELKRNDTLPVLVATLTDAAGVAVDLTNATAVRFHLKALDGTVKVNALATITTPASGIVSYPWTAADTDTAGDYWAEFEATFADGTVETFPNDRHLWIKIREDLA